LIYSQRRGLRGKYGYKNINGSNHAQGAVFLRFFTKKDRPLRILELLSEYILNVRGDFVEL
jgi:hypothetical protein